MPAHKIHFYLDRMLFGKVYYKIHRAIDKPWRVFGRNHRVYFHDPWSVELIARKFYPFDQNALDSALYHIQLDQMCTNDPAFKHQLELFADRAIRRRKRSKSVNKGKKAAPIPKDVKEMRRFCKQILEIEKLDRAIRS